MEKYNVEVENNDMVAVADNFGLLHKKVKYLEKNAKSDYKRNKKDHENMEANIEELDEELNTNIEELRTHANAITDLREETAKIDKSLLYSIYAFIVLHLIEVVTFSIAITQIMKIIK